MTDRRLPRPFATVMAAGFALVGAAFGVLYLFPELQATSRAIALASSFIPYALIPWALATLIVLASSRGSGRLLTLLPLAGLLAQAMVLLPYFSTDYAAPTGTNSTLRVMTLNMHYGQADTAQLLAEVERDRPDVLVLTEFTTQSAAILTNPRWTAQLPYHLGTTGRSSSQRNFGDPAGTQVLSRTPITELARATGTFDTNLAVAVDANGHQLVLIAAHPVNAVRGDLDGWLSEGKILSSFASGFSDQPLVIAGDLNAVPEHLTVRNLLTQNRLHESVQGWQPTYPADRLMPLITIDHVLASEQFRTISVRRFAISNTDHLGSVVELAQS
jgi:endonuclease/exonuclease/phosphatase (EEP) superfamily protein YafD